MKQQDHVNYSNLRGLLISKDIKMAEEESGSSEPRNKEPVPGASYLYWHNTVWNDDGQKEVEEMQQVHDLRRSSEGSYQGYQFRLGDDPETYRCSYGWAFILNTPENLLLYEKSMELRNQWFELKKKSEEEFAKVVSLK